MTDGQIDGDKVWFAFTLHDLEWLHDLIPRGDEFKRIVMVKIREMEKHQAGVVKEPTK